MAGYDEMDEAAIPEEAEYTAGTVPQSAPDDNSGAAPVEAITTGNGAAPAAPAGPPAGQGGPLGMGSYGPLAPLVRLLMGEGADNPAMLKQAAAEVDPTGQLPRGDANILALHAATVKGGEQAGYRLAQANRVAYNARQSFAFAALNGTQGKPPDIEAAIAAANEAAEHVLDGNNVKFMVSRAGQITATVTPPDGQSTVYDLTPEQFRRYLDVGKAGQWDRVTKEGIPGALQKVISGPGADAGPKPRGRERELVGERYAREQDAEAIPTVDDPAEQETNFGKTPSTINLSGSTKRGREPKDLVNYDPETSARADRMFPGITQQRERDAWINQQEREEAERKNKLAISQESAKGKVDAAGKNAEGKVTAEGIKADASKQNTGTKADAYRYNADQKLKGVEAGVKQKAAHDQQVEERARADMARKERQAKMMTANELSPEDKAAQARMAPGTSPTAQPTAAPSAPVQRPPGPPPVPGARFYKGSWYTRGPNGEAVPYQP